MGTDRQGGSPGRGAVAGPARTSSRRLSFEFFPPKTDRGRANLLRTARRLRQAAGDATEFCSVTYGAGGSTRTGTFEAVHALREGGINAVPHLSWGADPAAAMRKFLARYRELGVDRIVALRGDIPSGVGPRSQVHHAVELVRLIRESEDDRFQIEVAAYPEVHPDAPSPEADLDYLKEKVDAGANGCITQYFYHPESYFYFVDRCRARGIDAPIVPGIMPITNHDGLVRFSDACGADIPRWIRLRLEAYRDDDASLGAFGTDVVTRLCERLLDGGAPGLHFYTLNKAPPTLAIAGNLGLADGTAS